MMDINKKSHWGIDDLYKILTENQPVTEDARRVWEGIANTFYIATLRDKTGKYAEQVKYLFELAKGYRISIPSKKIKSTVEFIKNTNQKNLTEDEQRNTNIPEEFRRNDISGTPIGSESDAV